MLWEEVASFTLLVSFEGDSGESNEEDFVLSLSLGLHPLQRDKKFLSKVRGVKYKSVMGLGRFF